MMKTKDEFEMFCTNQMQNILDKYYKNNKKIVIISVVFLIMLCMLSIFVLDMLKSKLLPEINITKFNLISIFICIFIVLIRIF